MTDAREMLRVLRDDLDAILVAVPVPKTRKVVRSRLNAILDAMPEGPGLPWVSVEKRLPEPGDAPMRRVLAIPRFPNAPDGAPMTLPLSLVRETPDHYRAWCEVSDIPLPADESAGGE